MASYPVAAVDAVGSSTGAGAVALGVPDYRFVNDSGLPFGGTSSDVFDVGESTTLSFAQPLRNIAGANDLLVSAYVGGLGETDSAQVLVEVSSDGASFASIGTLDTATGRTSYPLTQERDFASVKHFALDFGANDLVTHVRLTNVGGTAEGLRLDALEGLHPVSNSSHAFELRIERYREDTAQRFFVRLKNTADPGGVAIRELRMVRALNASLEDTRRSMIGLDGLAGELLCVENCNADNGELIPFSRHVWSLDGVAPAPAGTGVPPGGSVNNRRSESFDTDSTNVPYLAGFAFVVTWTDGYEHTLDYSNDVLGQQTAGALYQKYLYFSDTPALSGPRPADYYEFRRVSTISFTDTADVPNGHEPQPGGRLHPDSQHFRESGMHVEGFWVPNDATAFRSGHFHDLENGYETSHGFETTPGLGQDRQGIVLERVDGGAFDLESLDLRAFQATQLLISTSYDPSLPAVPQFTAFPVSATADFETLTFTQFQNVTRLFLMADLTGESEMVRWDDIVIRTSDVVDLPPVANAGSDQTVVDADDSGAELVTLDGAGSSDLDGSIASFVWTEGAMSLGSGATLEKNLAVGTHAITLTVTDDDGNESTDSVTIVVEPVNGGQAPVAVPGADQTLLDDDDNGSEVVTLDGSGSFDPDG
ncbi:MAG TPA: PKD domain-containing protein, partial [Myxococcota bacterium]|nr:PKD domain-containing protein [Myxococcota bacterium]